MPSYQNFQRNEKKHKNAVNPAQQPRNYAKAQTKTDKLMEGARAWIAFYRQRPDIFVEEYLGITLKDFQKVWLYEMIHSNYSMLLASRGLSKTFTTCIYCVVRCILYPDSKIVVASGVKAQAMKMITEKFPELLRLSKTGMLQRELSGEIRKSMNTDEPNIEFLNGSWIKVVAANENARSGRCNVLVLDEFRLIKPEIYKSVLKKFLMVARQPAFLQKEEYKGKQEYLERNQEIFMTSCYYKYNWAYPRYEMFYKKMMNGEKYFLSALPYHFSIKEGLVSKEQIIDELKEDDNDFIIWLMEMECMFFGENEKAYFKLDELVANQSLLKAIYPKHMYNYVKKDKFIYPKKAKDEIRVLTCDIAALSGNNDLSIFTLICLIPVFTKNDPTKVKHYQREVRYMEFHSGTNLKMQALYIRRLMNDLDCDYIVLDRQGNGIGVYDNLCTPLEDKERDIEYKPIITMNEKDVLESHHVYPNCQEIIYTFAGTEEINSEIAVELKACIEKGKIKFLENKSEIEDYFTESKEFLALTPEKRTEYLMPFVNTQLLLNEMVMLEKIPHDKYVKLKEPRSGRKDRYMSVAYGNYFCSYLEKKNLKDKKTIKWEDYFLS